eukprot:5038624-Karenia_brevis.AAC.1
MGCFQIEVVSKIVSGLPAMCFRAASVDCFRWLLSWVASRIASPLASGLLLGRFRVASRGRFQRCFRVASGLLLDCF